MIRFRQTYFIFTDMKITSQEKNHEVKRSVMKSSKEADIKKR